MRKRSSYVPRPDAPQGTVTVETFTYDDGHPPIHVATDALVSTELEAFEARGDAGAGYTVVCPECRGEVQWAEYQWREAVCDCGRTWTIVPATAVGVRSCDVSADFTTPPSDA